MRRRNEVRIIGGKWRGHRLRFPPAPGLRPTPDAVRETLFNWLSGELEGRRALDLFAGSGALGLEAASRGAREVWLVEKNPTVFRALKESVARLKAEEQVRLFRVDALHFLKRGSEQPFDLVFVDPPFGRGLVAPACRLLEARGWLKEGSLIYVESESHAPPPPLPEGWRLLKEKRAGELVGRLYRKEG